MLYWRIIIMYKSTSSSRKIFSLPAPESFIYIHIMFKSISFNRESLFPWVVFTHRWGSTAAACRLATSQRQRPVTTNTSFSRKESWFSREESWFSIEESSLLLFVNLKSHHAARFSQLITQNSVSVIQRQVVVIAVVVVGICRSIPASRQVVVSGAPCSFVGLGLLTASATATQIIIVQSKNLRFPTDTSSFMRFKKTKKNTHLVPHQPDFDRIAADFARVFENIKRSDSNLAAAAREDALRVAPGALICKIQHFKYTIPRFWYTIPRF